MRRGALISVPSLPVEFIEGGSATLSPGKEYWVTAAAKLTLAKSARLGDRLKVVNSADLALTISGSAIGGVDNTGNRYADQSSVRLPAGGEADFVRSRRGWRAKGCDRAALSFAYNGTPLSLNPANPFSASGFFHYLGMVQGGGTWVNPANTAVLTSAASAIEMGAVANLTDRVGSGQNVYTPNSSGGWFGWAFTRPFRCSGFWIQTRSPDGHQPRTFELLVSTGSGLASGASLANWVVCQSWTNQTQITGGNQYFYFSVSLPIEGNRLALRSAGLDASGAQHFAMQEVELFGVQP
jgi:hypothetical protein